MAVICPGEAGPSPALMNRPPAYQHYARDWLVSTTRLSLEEQGAYQRLLDYEWIEGPLHDDPAELARLLSVTPAVFKRLWRRLATFFERGDDGLLRNLRLEHDREHQRLYREQQRERGRLGAAKRWPAGEDTTRHSAGHGDRDGDGHGGGDDKGDDEGSGDGKGEGDGEGDGPAGSGPVALQSASASADNELHGGASRRALMCLVRRHLYVPDGKPPPDWDEARDGSILKAFLKRRTPGDVAIAIEGLAIIRDQPGVFADPIDWLAPGEKVTLRALYNQRSGVLDVFMLATQAYWKRENSGRGARTAEGLEPIGPVVRRAMERAP